MKTKLYEPKPYPYWEGKEHVTILRLPNGINNKIAFLEGLGEAASATAVRMREQRLEDLLLGHKHATNGNNPELSEEQRAYDLGYKRGKEHRLKRILKSG